MAEEYQGWASDFVEALSYVASQTADLRQQVGAILAATAEVQGPTASEALTVPVEQGLSASEAMPALFDYAEVAETLVDLGRLFELEPGETKKAYQALRERGWVLTHAPWRGDIDQINSLLELGEDEELEEFLCANVRTRAVNIIARAIENAPKRESILRRALELHQGGDYIASVPLLLTQADGLVRDLFNSDGLFKTKYYEDEAAPDEEKRRTQAWLALQDELAGEVHGGWQGLVLDVMMLALTTSVGFALGTEPRNRRRDKGSRYNPVNRHGVLHGVDVDYATEGNSLRCIALLGYLCEFADVLRFRNVSDEEFLDISL